MKGPDITQLVYAHMFPKPKTTDPQNFQSLLQRQLVPEVRHETQAFYGHLSSQEAKYPGLDYWYQPHRNRLSRYPWHRRLFRAFDALKLTEHEIAGVTHWEGTRWAKERFEREQGVIIRDTTGEDIQDWVPPNLRVPRAPMSENREMRDEEGQGEEADVDEDMEEDEESDGEMRSVGIELNERLRAAALQREAGNDATVMDEEWEQWLKDAVEAGGIPYVPSTSTTGTRSIDENENPALHPRVLNAVRLGQWQQIPDFLHSMVRQNIEANARRMGNGLSSTSSPRPPTFSSRVMPRAPTLAAPASAAQTYERDFGARSTLAPARIGQPRAPLGGGAP